MKCVLVVAALFATIFLGVNGEITNDIWKDCSKKGAHMKIVSLTVTPDPPKKGESLNVTGNFYLDEQVTGGQVEVKLSYGEVPLFHQLIDLCKLLEQVNITCPVKVGPVNNVLVKTKIPQEAPSGNYIGSAIMNDKNKQQLVCIELNFKL